METVCAEFAMSRLEAMIRLFKAGTPTIEQFLRSPDLSPSLQADIPKDACKFVNDNAVALFEMATSMETNDIPELSVKATTALSCSNKVGELLSKNAEFHDAMRTFLESQERLRNPVFVGHFREIFEQFARRQGDNFGKLEGVLTIALNHVDILGFRDLITYFIGDVKDFAIPYERPFGMDFIAASARRAAERACYSTDEMVQKQAKDAYFGIFYALLNAMDDSGIEAVANGITFEFIRNLTEAVFLDPVNLYTGFRHGMRVLERFLINLIPPKGEENEEKRVLRKRVSRFIKEYSHMFYKRMGIDEYSLDDWRTLENCTKIDRVRVMIDAFPILWYGAIYKMYPLFFRNRVISSEFSMAFRSIIKGVADRSKEPFFMPMKKGFYVKWMNDCNIVKEICDLDYRVVIEKDVSSPEPRKIPDAVTLNPHITQIARLISRREGSEVLKFHKDPELSKRFSLFLVERAVPLLDAQNVLNKAMQRRPG